MNKKNAILGGILVVLIALAYLYSAPFQEWRKEMARPDNFLAGLNVDNISKIALEGAGQGVVLEKVGDKWRIAGTKDFYLKDEISGTLIDKLNEAKVAEVELASENAEKKSDFDTGDDSGLFVTFSEGENVVASVVVGKLTNDFAGTYIAEPDSDKTFVLKTDLRNALARQDWYDMAIFDNETDLITKIRFQYPNREFTVEKEEETWKGTQPYIFSVDDDKIETIANLMSKLTAIEIPAQTFDNTGLDEHEIIVQATGDGIDNTLMIGSARTTENEDDEILYYAKRGDSDNIYLITENDRDELDKQIWNLR